MFSFTFRLSNCFRSQLYINTSLWLHYSYLIMLPFFFVNLCILFVAGLDDAFWS